MGDGFDMDDFGQMKKALESENAVVKLVAPHGGKVMCSNDMQHKVDASIMTTESVLFDAIYIPGGEKSIDALLKKSKFIKFVNEAFKHCKAIAVDNDAERFLEQCSLGNYSDDVAVLVNDEPKKFIEAIGQHRNWERMEKASEVPV